MARRLVDSLSVNQIVVVFEEAPSVIVIPQHADYSFCKVLLSQRRTDKDLQALTAIPQNPSLADLWQRWLRTYTPSGAAAEALTQRMQVVEESERENRRQIAAHQRLDALAYPLTITAMVLGVLALGHILRWTGRGLGTHADREATRSVEIALLLMLGMAAVDLAWTILAGEAGLMREVNPFAASLIQSPSQLALFKIVATAAGCGILFAWRQRRQIQVATWWMCLVCTLVTFRWVVFDSLLS
jgi:hypothetical protein